MVVFLSWYIFTKRVSPFVHRATANRDLLTHLRKFMEIERMFCLNHISAVGSRERLCSPSPVSTGTSLIEDKLLGFNILGGESYHSSHLTLKLSPVPVGKAYKRSPRRPPAARWVDGLVDIVPSAVTFPSKTSEFPLRSIGDTQALCLNRATQVISRDVQQSVAKVASDHLLSGSVP